MCLNDVLLVLAALCVEPSHHAVLFLEIFSVYTRYAGPSSGSICSKARLQCSWPLLNAKYEPQRKTIVSTNTCGVMQPGSPFSQSTLSSENGLSFPCTQSDRVQSLHFTVECSLETSKLGIPHEVEALECSVEGRSISGTRSVGDMALHLLHVNFQFAQPLI